MKKVIMVYHDGKTEEIDVKLNAEMVSPTKWRLANLVLEIDVESGKTEIVKNRYGDRGIVQRHGF